MPPHPTQDDIVRDAKARIAQLDELIRQADAEMNRIRQAARGEPSAAERAEIKELSRDRQTLSKSIRRIALVSAETLEKTDDLRRIVKALAAVRVGLEERRAHIEGFAASSPTFAAIVEGIRQLAAGIGAAGDDVDGNG